MNRHLSTLRWPLWLRNQIVRLQKARTRRRALAQRWEVVTCACGFHYTRIVQPNPRTYCDTCMLRVVRLAVW